MVSRDFQHTIILCLGNLPKRNGSQSGGKRAGTWIWGSGGKGSSALLLPSATGSRGRRAEEPKKILKQMPIFPQNHRVFFRVKHPETSPMPSQRKRGFKVPHTCGAWQNLVIKNPQVPWAYCRMRAKLVSPWWMIYKAAKWHFISFFFLPLPITTAKVNTEAPLALVKRWERSCGWSSSVKHSGMPEMKEKKAKKHSRNNFSKP